VTFGVTTQGFVAKRTEEIRTEIEQDLRSVFGDGIDLTETGPFGQIVGIYADRLGSIWSYMEQVYNSQYPSTSEGASLDNVASITGSVRQTPTSSKVNLTLFGDVGTVIPATSLVSVDGNSAAQFSTDAAAIIAAGVDNVQNISFPVLPEAGTFTLGFGGVFTGALNWDADAATIQAALEGLTTIGVGNVVVVGDVQSGNVQITFQNDLGSAPQALVTVGTNALTSHEQTTIQTVADVSANLDRTAFIIYDQAGSVAVWIDVDDSGSAPPPAALAADRAIEVTGVSTDDSADSVATAIAAALSADSEFSANAVGNVITVDDAAQGARTDASDVDTGFTIAVAQQGYSAGGLPINIAEGTAGVLPQTSVGATATSTGPIVAVAGTLTVIETPVTGWSSVTNPLDADPIGSDLENDPDFRIRRLEEIAIAGRATTEAVRSQLLALDGVSAVVVFENDLWVVDPDGRPPKSLDIVVENGDEDEIAERIFDVVAAGIETIGDITKIVTDSQSFAQTVKFSRPTPVNIWVELDLTVDSNVYPANGDDQVKAAVVAYGDALGIGKDVIVYGSDPILSCAFKDIPGITDAVIRVGKTSTPTTDDNVVIEPREVADFDTSRITVTQL